MAVEAFSNKDDSQAVMVCNTSDWAFGPIINEHEDLGAAEVLYKFCEWLPKDARKYKDDEMVKKYFEFRVALEQGDLNEDEES